MKKKRTRKASVCLLKAKRMVKVASKNYWKHPNKLITLNKCPYCGKCGFMQFERYITLKGKPSKKKTAKKQHFSVCVLCKKYTTKEVV